MPEIRTVRPDSRESRRSIGGLSQLKSKNAISKIIEINMAEQNQIKVRRNSGVRILRSKGNSSCDFKVRSASSSVCNARLAFWLPKDLKLTAAIATVKPRCSYCDSGSLVGLCMRPVLLVHIPPGLLPESRPSSATSWRRS